MCKKLLKLKKFLEFCTSMSKLNPTQNQIVSVATDMFLKHGFKAVTVDDLAKLCGISKKTLYESFEDKEEIVDLCVCCHLELERDLEREVKEKSADAIQEFLVIIENFQTNIKNMNANCITDLQRYYSNSFSHILKHKEYVYSSLVRIMKRGIKEGYFRKNINVENLAKYRVEADFMMIQNMQNMQSKTSFMQLQIDIMEMFLYGISTIDGHKKIETYLMNFKKSKKIK